MWHFEDPNSQGILTRNSPEGSESSRKGGCQGKLTMIKEGIPGNLHKEVILENIIDAGVLKELH